MKSKRFYAIARLSLIFIVCFFLCSCDPGSAIKYTITNKTNNPIKVKYQFVFSDGDTSIKSIVIAPDSIKLLNSENDLGYADQIDKGRDSIYFYHLEIAQSNKISHVNLKDKKYWSFKKENNQKATYALLVTDSLFNK